MSDVIFTAFDIYYGTYNIRVSEYIEISSKYDTIRVHVVLVTFTAYLFIQLVSIVRHRLTEQLINEPSTNTAQLFSDKE